MRRKLFWGYLGVGLLVLVLCIGLLTGLVLRNYEAQAFTMLEAEASLVGQGIEESGQDYLTELSLRHRLTWVDPSGKVLFDSEADKDTMANHMNRAEIRDAMTLGTGRSTHQSETLMERTLYYALRLKDGSVLRVSCTQSSVMGMVLMLLGPALGIALIIMLCCILLASRLARKIVEPINRIDLDRPAVDQTYPELRPLVDRIGQQNDTIRQQLLQMSQQQREFSVITENMSEGFLLLDCKKEILAGNHAAKDLLESTEKALRRTEKNGLVLDAVEAALAGIRTEKILLVDGRSWQCIASPVSADGQVAGVLVLLLDVTERDQREELRREFSANVSHELKTPMTAISGFAELMKEGMVPPEKIREFSGIIYKESQRLIDLINDIIELSRLDEENSSFDREDVDLYDMADDILENLRPIGEKRNISLSIQGEHATVNGVWQILNEMIYNLCDNAVKYNVEGGSVTVTVRDRKGHPSITVSDTGIGIPMADQGRVFERFYRVDKSHSREIGGTGLGLSIVKHGALIHGADLSMKSQPGVGTEISVSFP
ncbi:MAG: ATP-binding protein [Oscillospiraceae bacterium]|nr:ATP-binding protein [Oscillospiraceae bacterium]